MVDPATLPVLEPADEDSVSVASPQSFRPRHHRRMLVLSLSVLVLARLMSVERPDRVAMFGTLLPPICISYSALGVKCPGCGLTRSFVYLAHGDWNSAWQMHRFGWLIALATVAQIPYRYLCLRVPGRAVLGNWFPQVFGYTLIGVLIVNWLIEQGFGCAASCNGHSTF